MDGLLQAREVKGFLCLQGMDIPVFQRCALISLCCMSVGLGIVRHLGAYCFHSCRSCLRAIPVELSLINKRTG